MAVTREQKALALHRIERAEAALQEAQDELSGKNYLLTVNRAYYSVFYAVRAFLGTENIDSSKHSGVASLFSQQFIKTGIVPEVSFKAVQSLMGLRHEGDCQDFAEISMDEPAGSVGAAKAAMDSMGVVLKKLVK